MAVATSRIGPFFSGPIFQVGVNFPNGKSFDGCGLVCGLAPCACRVFGCVAHYHDGFFLASESKIIPTKSHQPQSFPIPKRSFGQKKSVEKSST